MRAMTAWMSSSVAAGFMTIIICAFLLKETWLERYDEWELRRSALRPWVWATPECVDRAPS
jgi:hypothetical protein